MRPRIIEAHGYRLIRFWNNDVLQNTDGVVQVIMTELAIAQNRP
jgi:BirA family biotin operon repressor/biotin-[acetyl-CoA-carboxylase] ligase